jgi:2-succinyl-5-enolpyruvyl-6-hydroxy-3-cyclohexene-1-carboxylate synthase
VCLLGDLAFCYDAGAMLHAAKRAISLRVVVVDNQGGGIFSFLPQAELDRDLFESSWAVPHGIELAGLAEAYGIPTRRAHSVDQAVEAVAGRGGEAGVEVVIVPSDRQTNVEVHRRLNEAIQAAVSQLTSGGDRRP